MNNKPPVYVDQEASENKLAKKSRENPIFPLAVASLVGSVLYGAYKFKTRGDLPISLYLIHLRVGAQGIAVGTLTCGMAYTLGKRLYHMWKGDEVPHDGVH